MVLVKYEVYKFLLIHLILYSGGIISRDKKWAETQTNHFKAFQLIWFVWE